MEKIYITGTGRCGTTFLIKLFSFLGFDTGYDRRNYKNDISENCNSGMEKKYHAPFYIIKNPAIILNIGHILNDKNIKIKKVIIPIREYKTSALSRQRNGHENGGLWMANNALSQLLFYHKIMADYIYYMTKHNIDTIFLDFDKMVNDKKYLYDNLKTILDEKEVSFETFSKVYDEVALTSKK